jgi:flagellar M-ring protein FliF
MIAGQPVQVQMIPGPPDAQGNVQMIPAPQQPQQMVVAAPGQAPNIIPAPRENMIDISRIEGQVRESSLKKVGEVVDAHPEEALAIIRTWLHQPV